MATDSTGNRRHFLGAAAAALVAAGVGVGFGCAKAQSSTPQLQGSEGNMPSLSGATDWLNSAPLTAVDLRGKVVLVQFWTFTCINWLRTVPYVRAWAEKYQDHGLVVIGVHTPEFGFERNVDNVRRAVQAMRVHYPIAIDNNSAVWDAFANQFWPALYFTDPNGRIRHHHFGEGDYEESERVLQQLLNDAGATDTSSELVSVDSSGAEVAADWGDLESTETYLGFGRTSGFASSGGALRNNTHLYAAPAQLTLNQWALTGKWRFEREAVVLDDARGSIVYQLQARDLHLVMGPASPATPVRFHVLLDGLPPGNAHGFDVDNGGYGTAFEQRLYQLIRQPVPVRERRFEIEFLDPGVEAYTFTFG